MFRNIVVAVDGSSHSDKAVAVAGELAGRLEADLTITHALIQGPIPKELARLSSEPVPEMPPMSVGGAAVGNQVSRTALQSIAKALLEQAQASAREAGAKSVETTWHEGDPANVVLYEARSRNADLVILGCRGLGGVKGLLMGSVSSKVNQLFEGSVLTVK